MEGAVFDKSMKLIDDAEKLVQDEGFYLKISFYSDCAKTGVWATPQVPFSAEEGIETRLKNLYKWNTATPLTPDYRPKIPIYKYKKRNDR